jgi:methylmalonyl-CoA mutase
VDAGPPTRFLVLGETFPVPADATRLARLVDAWPVSGVAFHEAGAGPATEAGLTLAAVVEGLRGTEDSAPAAVDVVLAVGREVFPEIAKLRAMRLLLHRLAHAAEIDLTVRLHAHASRRTLTRRDPWVNLLRNTTQAFAAITGGADYLVPTAFDAAVRAPVERARRIARNTPEILLRECHLGDVKDPAAGSYLVETLTDAIARRAWDVMREVEVEGGLARAMASGTVAHRLTTAWSAWEAELRSGAARITGVTAYADPDETPLTGEPPELGPARADLPFHRDAESFEDAPVRETSR